MVPLRLSVPSDIGEVLRLAADTNPFFATQDIRERTVLNEHLGLLIGCRASDVILLYLWTRPIDDLLPWMAHAARWLDRASAWRNAHGCAPSAAPARIVLAAPEIGDDVRHALRLLTSPVMTVRYVRVELGGRPELGWGGASAESSPFGCEESHAAIREQGPVQRSGDDELTPEEVAFFYRRASG